MHSAWDVNEDKMEHEDRHNPPIDRRAWIEIGVRQHPFDVSRIDFYYEVPNTNEVYFQRAKSPKQSVKFELSLRKSALPVVECD
jgi:hypothetical protein